MEKFCKRLVFKDAATNNVVVLLGLISDDGSDFIKIQTRSRTYEIKRDLILSIGDTTQQFQTAEVRQ